MAEVTKTIAEWERSNGILILGLSSNDLLKKITEEELRGKYLIVGSGKFAGINWSDREEWLKNNGHPITRANMLDHSLETNFKE